MLSLEHITAEWVRARMRALHLRQADIAAEIGLAPDKVSKSLTGKRKFQLRELESLGRLLAVPEDKPSTDPVTTELSARIASLPDSQKRIVLALVTALEQQDREP